MAKKINSEYATMAGIGTSIASPPLIPSNRQEQSISQSLLEERRNRTGPSASRPFQRRRRRRSCKRQLESQFDYFVANFLNSNVPGIVIYITIGKDQDDTVR